MRWLRAHHSLTVLPHPPKSPDLQGIEHAWAEMKRWRENEDFPMPRTQQELVDQVMEAWSHVTPDTCRKIMESMPRRLLAVYEANGFHSGY